MLYSLPSPPPAGAASLLHQRTPRHPLYRCRRSNGIHFVHREKSCGGDDGRSSAVMEQLLGYASSAPHTGMPRRLWACERVDGVVYHALDADCLPGHVSVSALGWVM